MNHLTSTLFTAVVLLASCNSRESKVAAEKESYQKAKEVLEQKEKKNPVAFLSVASRDKHNLLGQTVTTGTVTNNAKVCIYKDVQIELSYYSKTGTRLLTTNETVYEKIAPGHSADFKTKEFAPKGADSVAIKIIGARTN